VGSGVGRGQDPAGEDEDGHPDRGVDQEDPVPVEPVGEHSAQQDADTASARGHEADEAHRPGALTGLGEQRHDERERDGGDDRPAEPLHGARRDQHPRRAGQAARDGRGGEGGDAGEEHPAVPEQVAEPAAQQQEPAEGEQVGVDHPGQARLGEAEVLTDRRQRDVHDRRVEHDHQVAQAEHAEGEPA